MIQSRYFESRGPSFETKEAIFGMLDRNFVDRGVFLRREPVLQLAG